MMRFPLLGWQMKVKLADMGSCGLFVLGLGYVAHVRWGSELQRDAVSDAFLRLAALEIVKNLTILEAVGRKKASEVVATPEEDALQSQALGGHGEILELAE